MDENKSNVLYVDDEVNNLTAFTANFRRYYNIYTATSGREAMEIMRKVSMQVIVTDQRMPEMTGVQFLEAILPEYPKTIRMILTGFSDIEAIIKAINSGHVFRYVTKPWDQNELKTAIDSGIKLFELESEKQRLIDELNREVTKQQHILEMFQRYVPKEVINDILQNQNNEMPLTLGEYRIIAAMFVDIRNFTSMAEKLGPEKTLQFLNDFYELMTKHVEDHHGSVNRFLGDGILSLFGAPASYIDNQGNAVFCGLDILSSFAELNERYKAEIGREIAIGIGIHTGEVIVGNVGTAKHIEYTAIGDTVNTAERIQELTRAAHNSLYISEQTYNACKENIIAESLGPQEIRGRIEKMVVYKVKGKKM